MADGTAANAPCFYVYLTALVLIELSVGGGGCDVRGAGIATTDDVAMLTVHFPLDAASVVRTYAVDSRRAAELAACRRAIIAALGAWGHSFDALGNAELVIGELLGNLVRHAPGPAEVIVDVRGADDRSGLVP